MPSANDPGLELRDGLLALARTIRRTRTATGACRVLALALGVAGLLAAADHLLHLPAALRLLLLAGGASMLAAGLWRTVLRPAFAPATPEAAAQAIERQANRHDDLLVNACQLAAMPLGAAERGLIAPAAREARDLLDRAPRSRLIGLRPLLLAIIAAVAVAAGTGVAAWRWPDEARHAALRLLLPLADRPPLGAVMVALDPAQAVEVDEGSPLTIAVTMRVRYGPDPGMPEVRWREGADDLDPDAGAESERLELTAAGPNRWTARLAEVRRPLVLRARAGDGVSPCLHVAVAPRPRLERCTLRAIPPVWAGAAAEEQPGPPAAATVLAGTTLVLTCDTAPAVTALDWLMPGGQRVVATRRGGAWTATAPVAVAGEYRLLVPGRSATGIELARGALALAADAPPTAEIAGVEANLLVAPGSRLPLALSAGDDHGLRDLALVAGDAAGGESTTLRSWDFLGPPGPRHAEQRWELRVDPPHFQPGRAYVLAAVAHDRSPAAQTGRSRPVVVRVKAVGEVAAEDPGEKDAVASLQACIVRQREAWGASDNLHAQLAEAQGGGRLAAAVTALAGKQEAARGEGRKAAKLFTTAGDARTASLLAPLVEGEMGLVLAGLKKLAPPTPSQPGLFDKAVAPAPALAAVRDRQKWILDHLIALLASAAQAREPAKAPVAADKDHQAPDTADEVRALAADLKKYLEEQEKLLKAARSLMDQPNADLGDEKDKILGELARNQAELAKWLADKLTDFSKLPKQDFGDSSLSSEFNAVFQETSLAAAELYAKRVELAVPHEQSGLELATELQHNLEKWLMGNPDNLQWKMEEPLAPADAPLSELPQQLEDIVGDLIDQADQMETDIEDVTSQWMDNLDKGAGWLAGDGPISNMSAKGITSNVLPNQNEIGGRSGEGRTGRSHGQMVGDEAVGKGGRETPTRLTPQPFEQGSVKDSSKDPTGGSTGGGKVAGADAEGLRGPVPPELKQAMQRLAGAQAKLAQDAGAVALQMRQRRVPSGDLESATAQLAAGAEAARRGDAAGLRQHFSQARDHLGTARREVQAGGLGQEKLRLERRDRQGLESTGAERIPPGYEAQVDAYFRALAGQ